MTMMKVMKVMNVHSVTGFAYCYDRAWSWSQHPLRFAESRERPDTHVVNAQSTDDPSQSDASLEDILGVSRSQCPFERLTRSKRHRHDFQWLKWNARSSLCELFPSPACPRPALIYV